MIKFLKLFLLFIFPWYGYASSATHIVVAPKCLIEKLRAPYETLTSQADFSLIKVSAKGHQELIKEKNNRKKICGGFLDVTHNWMLYQNSHDLKYSDEEFLSFYINKPVTAFAENKMQIQYQNVVNPLLKKFNPSLMWTDLITFSDFQDRYANSEHGMKAHQWLKDQLEALTKQYHRQDVAIYSVKTPGYRQPSLVVKVGQSTDSGIVIGAHMDTTNSYSGKKPGADDDGSGSMTVLSTAKLILESGLQFKHPIYFIWYAAEEEGLIGSQEVVAHVQQKQIPLHAVMHFDMTGYAYKNDLTMWLMKDYTNPNLNQFLEALIKEYVKRPVSYTRCGYACSDHASWTQAGIPAAIAAEAKFENSNPNMHTRYDTIDKLSFTHMSDYAKLAIAFAVELAEPSKSD